MAPVSARNAGRALKCDSFIGRLNLSSIRHRGDEETWTEVAVVEPWQDVDGLEREPRLLPEVERMRAMCADPPTSSPVMCRILGHLLL